MKTPEERACEEYYTRKDIKVVLKVGRDVAERIFQNAHKRDEETLGARFMYYPQKKVRRESVLWATGKSLDSIMKALKNGATPAK